MEKKYQKYSVEDFTSDIDFVKWVKSGANKNKWENLVRENPQLSKEINVAKEIIKSLNFKNSEIDEKSIESVYKNIEQYFLSHQKTNPKIRILRYLKYAAIIVLFISIGVGIPYSYFSKNNDQFSGFDIHDKDLKGARLTLSTGEKIALTKKHTDLQFNTAGDQIKIDEDTIISSKAKPDPNAMVQVAIPYGMRSDILLSDGTKVWLNAGSKLVFPQKFTGKYRKVFHKGEAYFDVAKNKDFPFVVSSDNLNVTVLGTQFNVRNSDSDDELEVVLVEGSVSLKENGTMNFLNKEIKLKPFQKAIYNKSDKNTIVSSDIDVSYYISWKDGLLEFNRESILNVFKKLSLFYNVRFVTEPSVEMSKKISGKLDLKESLDAVMKVVSDAAPITYRIDGDKVMVTSKISPLPKR